MRKTVTHTYQLISNPEKGFAIVEDDKVVELWIDECEGGEAFELDLTYEDTFTSKEEAYNYIIETYGEVIELQ